MGLGLSARVVNLRDLLRNAAATSGRAVGHLSHAADSVSDAARRVPLVGPPLHAILDTAARPFAIAEHVLEGEPAAKVLAAQMHRELGDAKDALPWAETAVAFVPGIGWAMSGALGAGVALASGRKLTEAAMAGIEGAIPGGALAVAAYHLGRATMHRTADLGNAALDAVGATIGVPIPKPAQDAILAGLRVLRAKAAGSPLDTARVDAAIAQLPPDARSAALVARDTGSDQVLADTLVHQGEALIPDLTSQQRKQINDAIRTGVAVQVGQNLQAAASQDLASPAVQARLVAASHTTLDDVAATARGALGDRGVHGFDVGRGLMQHQATTFELGAARDALPSDDDRAGFDAALALHVGRVTTPAAPGVDPATHVDEATEHGLRAPHEQRTRWRSVILAAAAGLVGAVLGGPLWCGVGLAVGVGLALGRNRHELPSRARPLPG